MKKNGTVHHDQSPMRYFNNAKETLAKSPVEFNHYADKKYVAEAAGIAYLAARNAIIDYARKKGIVVKKIPKTYEGISHLINQLPQRNKLHYMFHNVFVVLHGDAYYEGLTKVSIIKDGMKDAEGIIKMLN